MSRFIDKDRGWERMKKRLEAMKEEQHVAVGVFGAKADADHGGKPNIEIATAHEFGLSIEHPGGTAYIPGGGFVSNEAAAGKNYPRTKPHTIEVPERSFIRGTVDEKASEIKNLSKNLGAKILDGALEIKQALGLLGAFVKGEIQKRMAGGIPPPLRASTIARKGSSVPLIDTGQLRASIDYEVRNV